MPYKDKAKAREASRRSTIRRRAQMTSDEKKLLSAKGYASFTKRVDSGDWASWLMHSVKASAGGRRKKGRDCPVEIDESFLREQAQRQGNRCYYTGLPLGFKVRTNAPLMVSTDRRDSSGGYTPTNTVLCCWIVNKMKSDTPEQEFSVLLNQIADSVFGQRWAKVA